MAGFGAFFHVKETYLRADSYAYAYVKAYGKGRRREENYYNNALISKMSGVWGFLARIFFRTQIGYFYISPGSQHELRNILILVQVFSFIKWVVKNES